MWHAPSRGAGRDRRHDPKIDRRLVESNTARGVDEQVAVAQDQPLLFEDGGQQENACSIDTYACSGWLRWA